MKNLLSNWRTLLLTVLITVSCAEEEVVPENKLLASGGVDKTAAVGSTVTLDGSASRDGNGKSFSFLWTIKSKPLNSIPQLATPRSATTTFVSNLPGTYVIELVITQGQFTDKDEVRITLTESTQDPDPIMISEDINSSTTLPNRIDSPDQPDYIVTKDLVVRGDLTISPGVVIAFQQNTSLNIFSGSINAKGTETNKIVFRGTETGAAFWKGIAIFSNSPHNEFEYATIAQGGSMINHETGVSANLTIYGTENSAASVKISNTSISDGGGYGLYVKGMSDLEGFYHNTFQDNANTIYIPARQVHKLDLSGTTGVSVVETGGPMLENVNLTWRKIPGGHYYLSSELFVQSGLTLDAGTVLKLKTGLTINVNATGYLKAVGTSQEKIVFSTATPNSHWNGIFFNSDNPNNTLEHAEVSNAGLNRIADAAHHANVVVGRFGSLVIRNSALINGLGYGLVTRYPEKVNADVVAVNTFANFQKGYVYPTSLHYPDMPALTGDWVDQWSFNKNYNSISANFYNKETGDWFGGASTPWEMSANNGIGIRFNEDGTFVWLIAESGPWSGCNTFSAEYITGRYNSAYGVLYFDQDYWRSSFTNLCDESQNIDINVEPQLIQLNYEIAKMYDVFTGEARWEIKFTNPDESTFSFYRK